MDYPGFTSSGSLSVTEYGQVPIRRLINSGMNILAHPAGDRLNCIDELSEVIVGLELNCHSHPSLNQAVLEKAKRLPLLVTKGSDKHSDKDRYYDDLSFYTISREDLIQFACQARSSVMR